MGVPSIDEATTTIESLRCRCVPLAIALVPSSPSMATMLERTRQLHPRARRALLLDGRDPSGVDIAPDVIARGLADAVVVTPSHSPDEAFHKAITDALYGWRRSQPTPVAAVRVVGERWSARSQQIRDRLDRNRVAYAFHAADSPEGHQLLTSLGLTAELLPVFVLADGRVLVQPDDTAVADRLTRSTGLERRHVDVTIIGGGPAGLAAAVYAASEGLSTLVLEREAIGGQAGTSSLIRNYLGFPHGIAGNELAVRAAEQAWLFGVTFHWMRDTLQIETAADGHRLHLSDGTTVHSRAVIVATGVSWRRLGVPSVEEMVGRGVCYGAAVSEAAAMQGCDVHIVGGGNSAGQAAVHLARYASRVTLVIRDASIASSMSQYLVDQLDHADNIHVRVNTAVTDVGGRGRVEHVTLAAADGRTTTEPSGGLFVLIGGEPRTAWLPADIELDPAGYILTGRDLPGSDRLPLETSRPGVFAAGDVRHGSIKRVASAVGEGALAVHACHQYLASTPTT